MSVIPVYNVDAYIKYHIHTLIFYNSLTKEFTHVNSKNKTIIPKISITNIMHARSQILFHNTNK